jgi:von Willebrand factor A domain-containing protein 8
MQQIHRNLDDGTHIIHQDRYFLLEPSLKESHNKRFIPAHKNFRVIAIAAPVPPYTGYPIDPPFRSRFQARFMDPIGTLLSLNKPTAKPLDQISSALYDKVRNIVLATQYASESRHSVDATSKSTLQPFPQTALVKLRSLLSMFPAPDSLSPILLGKLMLTLHPALIHAPFVMWGILSRQAEEAGLGPLGSPALDGENDHLGLLGYTLVSIDRHGDHTVRISFGTPLRSAPVSIVVPGGPKPCLQYPWQHPELLDFMVTDRFMGLLTSMLQAHALGWDISYVPPVLSSTASCSTSTLVRIFGASLGYEIESVHMYKELGGRELIMRRKVEDSGATSWEPR